MWYFQYKITIYIENEDNPPTMKPVKRTGLVVGKTFSEAISALSQYYGEDEIECIHCLKPIIDDVFEFEEVSADSGFDYKILAKEGDNE